jgi:hypothetical protein
MIIPDCGLASASGSSRTTKGKSNFSDRVDLFLIQFFSTTESTEDTEMGGVRNYLTEGIQVKEVGQKGSVY